MVKLFLGHEIIAVKPNTANMKLVFKAWPITLVSILNFIFLIIFLVVVTKKIVSTQFGTDVQWFKDGPKSYA